MDTDAILNSLVNLLSSDTWWSQILDFMLSKCEPFHSTPDISFEEYNIYMEFIKLIENLLNENVCKQNGISFDIMGNALMDAIKAQNETALNIKDTLMKTTDIIIFRTDMIAHNERIEKEVQSVMDKNFAPTEPNNGHGEIHVHEPLPPYIGFPCGTNFAVQ